ncbi:hypothetical protein [Wolbachia pipientis]|uniref:hypothetical protein n=1 Tax=Wolbachia pipientis TaxID=955 RepID=UPI001F4514DF|nr:hypothetical protein [Wolbachia pipientis]
MALSVSISAITSPISTLSCSFLHHFTIFPPVLLIVGERAGINISIGIYSALKDLFNF